MSSADSKVIAYTPVDQVKTAYDTVVKAHSTGITKTYSWRLHQLKQLGYLIQENQSLFEEALVNDLGRPREETHLAELNGAKNEILSAIKNLKNWMKPQDVKTDLAWVVTGPKIYHEPKGVVLIIGAWNYPIALLIGPLIGAIAGGNSVILKPSENCISATNLTTQLINKYMDPRNIQVVNGDHNQASKLLELKFDHIFFTGNQTVGKIVAMKAAESLTPVTLELGGKCPVVIFEDADLEITARRVMWAKLLNAGQTCIAPDYLLLPKKIQDRFIELLQKILFSEFYPKEDGSAKVTRSLYAQIINERQFNRLKNLLSSTKGDIVPLKDLEQKNSSPLKFPITLIKNVREDDEIMKEEIFGPILPILTYESQDELVQKLRNTQSSPPLAIYAFSKSEKNLNLVRSNTKSGQLVFNELLAQFLIPGLPFGGFGVSGSGNYHGYHSFLTFTHERASLNLPFWAESLMKLRNPPYSLEKFKLLQLVLGPGNLSGKSDPEGVPRSEDGPLGVNQFFQNNKKTLACGGFILIGLHLLLKPRLKDLYGGGGGSYFIIDNFKEFRPNGFLRSIFSFFHQKVQ